MDMDGRLVDLNSILTPQAIEWVNDCLADSDERYGVLYHRITASVEDEPLVCAVGACVHVFVALLVAYSNHLAEQDPNLRSEFYGKRFQIPPEELEGS